MLIEEGVSIPEYPYCQNDVSDIDIHCSRSKWVYSAGRSASSVCAAVRVLRRSMMRFRTPVNNSAMTELVEMIEICDVDKMLCEKRRWLWVGQTLEPP